MQPDNTPTFLEMLKRQIEEEQQKYNNALHSNNEIWELKLIRDNIKKLKSSLELFVNNIRGILQRDE